jgi:hypothetical protein
VRVVCGLDVFLICGIQGLENCRRETRAKGPRRNRISERLEVDGQEKGKRHGTVSGVTLPSRCTASVFCC